MIIFGTRSKIIEPKDSFAPTTNCAHCNQPNTVHPALQFSYFHIFWIPVFPYSKKYVTECAHCKNFRRQKELGPDELQELKNGTHLKIPWGYYTGLVIIVLPIVLALLISIFDSTKS